MIDFDTYTGNLILERLDFETLAELFDESEYDVKEKRKNISYVGKVGKFEEWSHIKDPAFGTEGTVSILFENGVSVVTRAGDVTATTKPCTSKEFLPTVKKDNANAFNGYRLLTQEEKDFADKVFLHLLPTRAAYGEEYAERMFHDAIHGSLTRTYMYNKLKWPEVKLED